MILNIKGVRLYWSKSNIRYTSMGLHHTRDQHIAAQVLGGGNPFIRALDQANGTRGTWIGQPQWTFSSLTKMSCRSQERVTFSSGQPCRVPFTKLWWRLGRRWVTYDPRLGSFAVPMAHRLTFWDVCLICGLIPGTPDPILVCDLSTDAIIGTDILGSILPHTLDIKHGLLFTEGGVCLQLHRRDTALSGRVFTVGHCSILP